jgi:hypothetical protein
MSLKLNLWVIPTLLQTATKELNLDECKSSKFLSTFYLFTSLHISCNIATEAASPPSVPLPENERFQSVLHDTQWHSTKFISV